MTPQALLQVLDEFLASPVVKEFDEEQHPNRSSMIMKADPFWRRLHAIADRAAPPLQEAILNAIAATVAGVDVAALQRALASGNLEAAMRAIPWQETGDVQLRAAYQAILGEAFADAGEAAAEHLARSVNVGVSFNLENPRATRWAATVGAARVTEVSEETVAAIRSIISRGFTEGRHPYETARLIRGPKDPDTGQYRSSVIGLTERQAKAVWNYRDELQNDEIERDTVTEDRMVERYRDELLLSRAETIARTETIAASNEGQQELWRQARETGVLTGTERRIWIVTPDDRLCEACLSMGNAHGDVERSVGLDEEFDDEGGEFDPVLVPPLHPNCRCAVGLVDPYEDTST